MSVGVIMISSVRKVLYKNSDLIRKYNISLKNLYAIKLYDGAKHTLNIEYNNTKYKFTKSYIDDNLFILESQSDQKYDCVTIIISPIDGIAEIHGIGNDKSCLTISNTNIGSTLLKITLKMLKKLVYQDEFAKQTRSDNQKLIYFLRSK